MLACMYSHHAFMSLECLALPFRGQDSYELDPVLEDGGRGFMRITQNSDMQAAELPIFSRKSPCYLACQELQKHFAPERMLEAGNRLHTVEVLASRVVQAVQEQESRVSFSRFQSFGLLTLCSELQVTVALGSRKIRDLAWRLS